MVYGRSHHLKSLYSWSQLVQISSSQQDASFADRSRQENPVEHYSWIAIGADDCWLQESFVIATTWAGAWLADPSAAENRCPDLSSRGDLLLARHSVFEPVRCTSHHHESRGSSDVVPARRDPTGTNPGTIPRHYRAYRTVPASWVPTSRLATAARADPVYDNWRSPATLLA